MYTDPYTNEPIECNEETFVVRALADWTNRPLRVINDVPLSGLNELAEQLLFEAWDHGEAQVRFIKHAGLLFEEWLEQTGPATCEIVAEQYNADGRCTKRFRLGQFTAQPDSSPTPRFTVEHVDPTLPEVHQTLGPYSD